ncbi:hypothetical protein FSP39_025457 [Pinctada imbricata]|uniref:Uncharacterized protein n=1 Tax=Pinctada imbricata TaxID=66713 RepID=A0AA89BPB9_PINIB|nr:hypothetical protein FSP39_025457 [Pinctada imbricata]
MANVYVKKSNAPRSTTLQDFCGHDATKHRVLPRILSPTRRANPHPKGLVYQLVGQKRPLYGIWHPDFHSIGIRMPKMLDHIGWVNFSSGPTEILKKELGKPPNIKYKEDTTSRKAFCEPIRFPELVKMNPRSKQSRYGYTPDSCRVPVKGIVPNLVLKDYEAVNQDF